MHQSRDSFAKIWPELEGFPQIFSSFLCYGLSEEQPQVLRPPLPLQQAEGQIAQDDSGEGGMPN
jgi:hypothetical protein